MKFFVVTLAAFHIVYTMTSTVIAMTAPATSPSAGVTAVNLTSAFASSDDSSLMTSTVDSYGSSTLYTATDDVTSLSTTTDDVTALTTFDSSENATAGSDTADTSTVAIASSSTTTSSSTSSASPTTTKTTTTTTPDPVEGFKCNGKFPGDIIMSTNVHFQMVFPDDPAAKMIRFLCNPGFRYVSGCTMYRCGGVVGWTDASCPSPVPGNPKDPILCEPITFDRPEPPEPEGFPSWVVPATIAAAVLVTILIVGIVLLLIYLRSDHSLWKQVRPLSETEVKLVAKEREVRRRGWPWKRPSRPVRPQGHLGPDGVAWFITKKSAVFPPSKR